MLDQQNNQENNQCFAKVEIASKSGCKGGEPSFQRPRAWINHLFAPVIFAGIGIALTVGGAVAQDRGSARTLVASQAALPCIDCLWQGAWCQICAKLPLTIDFGGTSSVSDADVLRLSASPWLGRAGACMAKNQFQPVAKKTLKPLEIANLADFATQSELGQRLNQIQSCIEEEIEPAASKKPRWRLKWNQSDHTITVKNDRQSPETALLIAAAHELKTDLTFEINLLPENAAVKLEPYAEYILRLPVMEELGVKGYMYDVAVVSASKITADRNELTTLTVLNGEVVK